MVMGAFLVAISPQTPRQNDFTLQQHGLPFPILWTRAPRWLNSSALRTACLPSIAAPTRGFW
jgi:peroxiredoxin